MFRKFLIPLLTIFYLFGCGQSVDQHLDEQQDIYTDSVSGNEEALVVEENNDEAETETEKTENNQLANEEDVDENSQSNTNLSDLKVHYIDAGQADATLFQYTEQDEHFTILYDTGDWNKNDVVNYLDSQNITYIDLVIVSHPHADHIGQLADIVQAYEVGEVWLSGNTSSSKTFQKSVEAIMASDADYYEPRVGESFEIGPMEIEVLHPEKLSGDLNQDSISLRFVYGDMKFIFTGDAYKEQELQMIHNGMEVEANFIQLGHHGSNTSSDQTFLQAVNPDVAIYSAGANNSYGHPHREVVSLIQDLGIKLYGTDVHGTIIVTTDGSDYDILTKEDGTISPKSTGTSNNHHNPQQADQKKDEQQDSKPDNHCININQASYEEIQKIIHIGPARAQDLIDQRPFDSVDDLTSIKGIGNARIADIKEEGLACVGG